VSTALYDGIAAWYDENRRPRPGVIETARRLAGRGPGSCLDLGCGTGFYFSMLADLGWTVTGIDLSENQLRLACGRAGTAVDFVGPHSEFAGARGIPTLDPGYGCRGRYTGGPGISPTGLRAKVGAVHLTLGDLLRTILDADLRIEAFEEPIAADREYPHWLALRAAR
jgi:hypothetical protein